MKSFRGSGKPDFGRAAFVTVRKDEGIEFQVFAV